jgi:hypothetical protein
MVDVTLMNASLQPILTKIVSGGTKNKGPCCFTMALFHVKEVAS